ncbi:MAG TPA: hypothetical protein VN512_13115 [Clostridia bacterium]|nr:hypothetical protein [Clostridia bacterium]
MSEQRLIDANALMDVIRQHDYPLAQKHGSVDNGMFTLGIQQAVDEQPTIDPFKHGRWIDNGRGPHCSECEVYLSVSQSIVYHNSYCPNCGARMDGEVSK